MNSTTSDLLFRAWPQIAIALFAGGLCVRAWLVAGRRPASRRAIAEAVGAFVGGRAARASVAALLAAHLAALLFPRAILAIGADPLRLRLLEALGVVVGAAVLAVWGRAVWRHLRRRRGSALLDLADAALLGLLAVAISTGLIMALAYRWGSSWGVATLTPWARSLAAGHPATAFVEGLPLAVRLHVVASLAALAVFPFSRLGPLPILAGLRALDLASRPLAGLVGALAAAAERRNLAGRLWPEPEIRWIGPLRDPEAARGADVPARRPLPGPAAHEPSLRLYGSKT
jgi:nitrate reductase gamma subunit